VISLAALLADERPAGGDAAVADPDLAPAAAAEPGVGTATATVRRFVTVRVGTRRVALAVEAVTDVRSLPVDALTALPPLLAGAEADGVAALGALDADVLLVLRAARLVPESTFAASAGPERSEGTRLLQQQIPAGPGGNAR
jgi:hypothetical protein